MRAQFSGESVEIWTGVGGISVDEAISAIGESGSAAAAAVSGAGSAFAGLAVVCSVSAGCRLNRNPYGTSTTTTRAAIRSARKKAFGSPNGSARRCSRRSAVSSHNRPGRTPAAPVRSAISVQVMDLRNWSAVSSKPGRHRTMKSRAGMVQRMPQTVSHGRSDAYSRRTTRRRTAAAAIEMPAAKSEWKRQG